MRMALLTGAAALALAGTAGARAETIYVTEPNTVVAPGYVYTAEPNYVVSDRSYVITEPRAVVVSPPTIVAPRRERVIVVPRREREIVVEQPASAPPRDSFAYRGTWRSNDGIITTSTSSGSSCVVDINGFERCY